MSNKHQVAGILNIVSGVIGLFWALMFLLAAAFFQFALDSAELSDLTLDEQSFVYGIILFTCIFSFILSILAIVGGVFALQRKVWGLTLVGAIAGILTFFPTGIPAIIFVALSREEFVRPPAPMSFMPPQSPTQPPASPTV